MNIVDRPATVYAASIPRFVRKFGSNDAGELWIADVKACAPGGASQVFQKVLFVESEGTAYIFGIEHEDGYPRGVRPEIAATQQLFIDFLREQNEIRDRVMGVLAVIFQGSEYASQARATAAYMIHRPNLTYLAVGFRNRAGKYVCEKFEDEDEFLENARATLPFDELDR